ncbi:MAG: hypothetical protein WCQ95_06595 [Bacteroidota bacterium]
METGWKPMPVIIKVFWIIMIVDALLAIFTMFSAYSKGFDLVGITFFGLPAVNVVFVFSVLIPTLLIVGIYKRFRFVWLITAVYFVFAAVNLLMSIPLIDLKIGMYAEEMSDSVEQLGEPLFNQILYGILFLSLLFGAAFNLAMMIIFVIKRNYFMKKPVDIKPFNDSESLS